MGVGEAVEMQSERPWLRDGLDAVVRNAECACCFASQVVAAIRMKERSMP